MIAEFIKKEDLEGDVPPSRLKIYLKGILASMVENTLIDGRSRRNRQAAHGSRFKVKFVRPPSKG